MSVDGLHAALRAIHHDAAIPRLRELHVENTINVRREAAVTLAHLGDAAGRQVIEQEVARYRGQKYPFYSWGEDVVKALDLLKARAR